MSEDNEPITIEGVITHDPQPGKAPDGRPWIWLLVQSRWPDGERVNYRCFAWDQLAANLEESLRQGAWVMVTGRERERTFQDRHRKARPVTVIDVSNVGASLRHATVTIHAPEQDDASPPTAASAGARPAADAEPAPVDAPATAPKRRGTSALPSSRVLAPRLKVPQRDANNAEPDPAQAGATNAEPDPAQGDASAPAPEPQAPSAPANSEVRAPGRRMPRPAADVAGPDPAQGDATNGEPDPAQADASAPAPELQAPSAPANGKLRARRARAARRPATVDSDPGEEHAP